MTAHLLAFELGSVSLASSHGLKSLTQRIHSSLFLSLRSYFMVLPISFIPPTPQLNEFVVLRDVRCCCLCSRKPEETWIRHSLVYTHQYWGLFFHCFSGEIDIFSLVTCLADGSCKHTAGLCYRLMQSIRDVPTGGIMGLYTLTNINTIPVVMLATAQMTLVNYAMVSYSIISLLSCLKLS